MAYKRISNHNLVAFFLFGCYYKTMSKAEKLLKRFLSKPKDFTYNELKKLLAGFGYENISTGKTSGSGVTFVEPETRHVIKLHKPHPRPEMKRYQLDYIEETLRNKGVI